MREKFPGNGYHGNENVKNDTLARETLGATDLKLGMDIQLHSGSNMGWVVPSLTSSSGRVRLEMLKLVFQE